MACKPKFKQGNWGYLQRCLGAQCLSGIPEGSAKGHSGVPALGDSSFLGWLAREFRLGIVCVLLWVADED